jgi:hypothetical protein
MVVLLNLKEGLGLKTSVNACEITSFLPDKNSVLHKPKNGWKEFQFKTLALSFSWW